MRGALRSGPLFSIRQLLICLATMLVALMTDALFFHTKPIQITAGFATELAIHTLGFYNGLTVVVLSNLTETR